MQQNLDLKLHLAQWIIVIFNLPTKIPILIRITMNHYQDLLMQKIPMKIMILF